MNRVGTDEDLSAYLDDDLPADERVALERRLDADGDLRVTMDAMVGVRATLSALTVDVPDGLLPQFRSLLDERRATVLDRPIQESLRAMRSTLETLRGRLSMNDQRRRIRELTEVTASMCPGVLAGETR
ncbi:hypothetical protein HN371_19135 [Candidatus Poribacteria bacterium]|nr:hypothetical protein [Candidatus Poribacteria bacterium]MBT7807596.1 hypothetical protein [Candidatus Poribacteria bacterium]